MEVRYLGPPETTLSQVYMKIESQVHITILGKLYVKLTRWHSTKPLFYQFSQYFSFCCCSISIKWISSCILCVLASMCEYWSCALQSKLSRPPEISRCRAFTWIIVVPVNQVTRVVQARYLVPSPPKLSWFHVNGQAFKTVKHVRTGISQGPEISLPPPRYLASCEQAQRLAKF